ncbi:MAG: alanine racemase [Deltaproteobacteria bacterium]|jgi:alanine racemase|nr:alanine racemase [Deltaproteobacteria bacterium]
MTERLSAFNECEVDLGALARNYERIAGFSKAPVMAVIKADAYGHGLVPAGLALSGAGCREIGVLDVEEALELKKHPVDADVTVLAGLHGPVQALRAVEAGLMVFAYDLAQIKALSKAAEYVGSIARVTIKIDTGMGRLGFPWEKAGYVISSIAKGKNVAILGLATHLATSGDAGAAGQLERFYEVGEKAKKRSGLDLRYSVLASGGILAHPGFPDGLSRAGLMLYGYAPLGPADPALARLPKSRNLVKSLERAMAVKSSLIQVREAKAGETVSYDRTFTVPRAMKVGTAPIGYAHGLGRARSSAGYALIGGRRARLLGRVCMNLTMYDIGGTGAAPGDPVILMGDQGGESIGADLIGSWEKTSAYEILCRLGSMNPRRHLRSAPRGRARRP